MLANNCTSSCSYVTSWLEIWLALKYHLTKKSCRFFLWEKTTTEISPVCSHYTFLLLFWPVLVLFSFQRVPFFSSISLIFLVPTQVIPQLFLLFFPNLMLHISHTSKILYLPYSFSAQWPLNSCLTTALSCTKIKHSIFKDLPVPTTYLYLYWFNNSVGPVTPRNNFHIFFSYFAPDKSS